MTTRTGALSDAEGSTEALRKVKEVEGAHEARLRRTREESALEISRFREEAEASVRAAQAAAETARDQAVSTARRRADEEAAAIVAEGEAEARRIAGAPPADLPNLRPKVLGSILEGFLPEKEG